MKILRTFFLGLLWLPSWLIAQHTSPAVVVTGLNTAHANPAFYALDYTLTDAENDNCEVWFRYSLNGGRSFQSLTATGDVGFPVMPGSRTLYFEDSLFAGADSIVFRVVASDRKQVDIQALVDRVDSNLLRAYIQEIAYPRHYLSQPARLDTTKVLLERFMQAEGLQAYRQAFSYNGYLAHNILARKPGHKNDSITYVIDAHFDGVSQTPGADDNASGVAGLMEAIRILGDYEFENSLRFIGFDVEEAGLIGSQRYVTQAIPAYERTAGVINFEMIGYISQQANSQSLPAGFGQLFPAAVAAIQADSMRGNFIINVGNVPSAQLGAAFDSAAARYVPGLRVISLLVPGTGQIAPDLRRSDHARFWDASLQALMITDGADTRNLAYHTANDTLARLNLSFMRQVVQASLGALAELAKPMSAGKGDYLFVEPVSVQAHAHKNCGFKLFPNPNDGRFQLIISDCDQPFGPASVRLFSLDGKQHFQQGISAALSHDVAIKLPVLEAGTYLLVVDDGHESWTEKVAIQP
jgi:hypothetical protein